MLHTIKYQAAKKLQLKAMVVNKSNQDRILRIVQVLTITKTQAMEKTR